jgi:hypothetical protein
LIQEVQVQFQNKINAAPIIHSTNNRKVCIVNEGSISEGCDSW